MTHLSRMRFQTYRPLFWALIGVIALSLVEWARFLLPFTLSSRLWISPCFFLAASILSWSALACLSNSREEPEQSQKTVISTHFTLWPHCITTASNQVKLSACVRHFCLVWFIIQENSTEVPKTMKMLAQSLTRSTTDFFNCKMLVMK